MAGETIKTEAICLDIRPWSQTSHIVTWLTPSGKVTTAIKGAVRCKSMFLGQYDFNYTCELVFYARAKGDMHAIRECMPIKLREGLRKDFRALAMAEYYRTLVSRLSPSGPDCAAWYEAMNCALDRLEKPGHVNVSELIAFELDILQLSGLTPDFSGYDPDADWSPFSIEQGAFFQDGRQIRISKEVSKLLNNPKSPQKNPQIPLDAARVIGVFYTFHLDCASEVRRTVLGLISQTNEKG